jgi:uncharacterized protein YjeT (DUF2065 family)
MEDFLVALGLVLALEGILYAAAPRTMKRLVATLVTQPEGAVRVSGLAAAILGVVIVWLVRR